MPYLWKENMAGHHPTISFIVSTISLWCMVPLFFDTFYHRFLVPLDKKLLVLYICKSYIKTN